MPGLSLRTLRSPESKLPGCWLHPCSSSTHSRQARQKLLLPLVRACGCSAAAVGLVAVKEGSRNFAHARTHARTSGDTSSSSSSTSTSQSSTGRSLTTFVILKRSTPLLVTYLRAPEAGQMHQIGGSRGTSSRQQPKVGACVNQACLQAARRGYDVGGLALLRVVGAGQR